MLRSFITNSILVGLLLINAAVLHAEDLAPSGRNPIKIESDYMKYNGDTKTSNFSGNVVVTDGQMRMTADTMDVTFGEGDEVKEIYSQGNVKIEKEGILTLSDKARFFNAEKKAVLTSNVRVWQGDNYLEGEKVTLYSDSNKIFVDRGTNKRVKIIIVPKEEKK